MGIERDEILTRLLRGCREGSDAAMKMLAGSDASKRAQAAGIMQAQVAIIDHVLGADRMNTDPVLPAVAARQRPPA